MLAGRPGFGRVDRRHRLRPAAARLSSPSEARSSARARRPPPPGPAAARTGPGAPVTVPGRAPRCMTAFHAAAVAERHRRPAPPATAPQPRLASRPGPRIPQPRSAAPPVPATAPAGHPHPGTRGRHGAPPQPDAPGAGPRRHSHRGQTRTAADPQRQRAGKSRSWRFEELRHQPRLSEVRRHGPRWSACCQPISGTGRHLG